MHDLDTQHAVARRLRLFSNFENLGEDARRAVVAAGEVRDVDSGEAICLLGERDEHVHYLLEGMVRLEMADGSSRDLHAGDGPARQALDEPGYKLANVVATHPCRIFRIDPTRLPGTPAPGTVEAVPTASFTETFSGQQLAALVGALRNEHVGLSGVAAAPPAADAPLGERTAGGVELDLPDLESTRGPLPVARDEDPGEPLAALDPLASLTRAFEADLRRHVDAVRAAERSRVQFKLKAYADKLKAQAEEQLKTKVKAMRARYEQAHAAREQDIRKRYEQLLDLANRLTRQKAEINQARQQIEDKLRRAESLHRELAELGGVVSGHLEQIDEMLPADDSELERDLRVQEMLSDVVPDDEPAAATPATDQAALSTAP